jgi:hypothetical protein
MEQNDNCYTVLKGILGFDEVEINYISCWGYLLKALVKINSLEPIEELKEDHISKDNVKDALNLCSDTFFAEAVQNGSGMCTNQVLFVVQS